MIKGILTREHLGSKRTIGVFRLLDNGGREAWQCFTCEDTVRGNGDPKTVAQWKVKGESAIPYGAYKVKKTHSPKYGRQMWEIQNVPGFQGIRIHAGNTEAHTEGCLLFGKFISPNFTGVSKSAECVAEFETVMGSLGNPEWEIEIRGNA